MSEQELVEAGFKKVDVPKHISDNTKDYYYYHLYLGHLIDFTSCGDNEGKADGWYVYPNDIFDLKITDINKVNQVKIAVTELLK
jgi:hypothetical protein